MLTKLVKHEFRATSRVMLPMFLALLVLSALANVSIRILDTNPNTFLNTLSALIMTAFGIFIFATCLMSIILMVQRFYHNLLTDEGYLMFTLPTSIHKLVWSKIIVSVVWFVVTFIAVCLSGLIASFRLKYFSNFINVFQHIFQLNINAYYTLNSVAFILEFLIFIFLACAATCLLFYAAMSVGHSFANHKLLLSVVFFFVFEFASQFIITLAAIPFGNLNFHVTMSTIGQVHSIFWVLIVCCLIYCAVFYIITTIFLRKRLNLE